MKFSVDAALLDADTIRNRAFIELKSKLLNDTSSTVLLKDCHALRPFINSHDHLIGNWYPPAIEHTFTNANRWVNDMRESPPVKERDLIFRNTLPMDFMKGRGKLLSRLGGYKNLFSGVTIVQDHAPRQKKSYYDMFPIEIIRRYRQCHSISLGNFWGGEDPVEEWKATKGTEPFIVHLGEGTDQESSREFSRLKELGLLQPNTLLIHGISLTRDEIKSCAEAGASICWVLTSNLQLIRKTIDIDTCLHEGVNVVIGTDSTLSGSINLLHEIKFAHRRFPYIPLRTIYRMISENAVRALHLPHKNSRLSERGNESLLLLRAHRSDPFENLMAVNNDDIILLVHKGLPLYGFRKLLAHFDIYDEDYFFYAKDGIERFVIGHPEKIMEEINHILGYPKKLPYLPFQQ